MPTTVLCPRCGAPNAIGINLQEVTFSENSGGNLVTSCYQCGRSFDAAPVDGTYSTGPAGNLVMIRALRTKLRTSVHPPSAEALAEQIEKADPRLAPIANWVRAHQDLVISSLVAIVLFVLGQLLNHPQPTLTPQELEQIIEHAQQQTGQPAQRKPSTGNSKKDGTGTAVENHRADEQSH